MCVESKEEGCIVERISDKSQSVAKLKCKKMSEF